MEAQCNSSISGTYTFVGPSFANTENVDLKSQPTNFDAEKSIEGFEKSKLP